MGDRTCTRWTTACTAALVPTEQWADERSEAIPEGIAALSADGAERVVVRIKGDTVTFELDGGPPSTRTVVERRDVRDSEGSGPFKAQTQALVLVGAAGPELVEGERPSRSGTPAATTAPR